jgi:dolichyl-phosphate beta-glucosyltransferase
VAFQGSYEVIVVNDGSNDGLSPYLSRKATSWQQLKVVTHSTNVGKGAAVRSGMLIAGGQRLLFTDADGATPIEDEYRLREAIRNGADIAVGSRLVKNDRHQRRRVHRRLMAFIFREIAHVALELPVLDTQCGFKMFRNEVGNKLFGMCDETGFLFDILILRLAMRLGYQIAEVPVQWQDVTDSRLNIVRDSFCMIRGLVGIERHVECLMQIHGVRCEDDAF